MLSAGLLALYERVDARPEVIARIENGFRATKDPVVIAAARDLFLYEFMDGPTCQALLPSQFPGPRGVLATGNHSAPAGAAPGVR